MAGAAGAGHRASLFDMNQGPPVGTPVCYRHPSRETYVRCTRCDRPICPDCMREASVGHQCPECVATGQRTQRPVRTMFGASRAGVHGYVTIGLIVVNTIVLLASVASAKNHGNALAGGGVGGLIGGETPLSDKLAVVGQVGCRNTTITGAFVGPPQTCAYGVTNGEYYRLFTAMFMHYGLLHLGANMYALWVFGRPLEAMFGPVRFLAIYLICGIGGNVAVFLFAPGQVSAGASTALFGLFAVFFFVLRRLNRSVAPLIPLIVINLALSFIPGVSFWGHLGGLITGGVVGYGMTHAPQARRNAIQIGLLVGVLVIFVGLTLLQVNHLDSLPKVTG